LLLRGSDISFDLMDRARGRQLLTRIGLAFEVEASGEHTECGSDDQAGPVQRNAIAGNAASTRTSAATNAKKPAIDIQMPAYNLFDSLAEISARASRSSF
jgi:hypothetical protein